MFQVRQIFATDGAFQVIHAHAMLFQNWLDILTLFLYKNEGLSQGSAHPTTNFNFSYSLNATFANNIININKVLCMTSMYVLLF